MKIKFVVKEKISVYASLLNRRGFKYILISYGAIFIFWIIHFNFLIKGDYHTSFSASLLEDLLFFGVLGLLLYYHSLRDDSQLTLRKRIAILANNRNNNEGAIDYLMDQICPVLAYNDTTDINIVIEDVDESGRFIKVFTDLEHRILNMCDNNEFEVRNGGFTIEADHKIGQDFGYIKYLGVVNQTTGGSEPVEPVNGPASTPLKVSRYNHPIDKFTIPKNGSAISKMSWAIWGKLNGDRLKDKSWLYLGNKRFSNNIYFQIVNQVDLNTLFLDVRIRNDKTDDYEYLLEGFLLKSKKVKRIKIDRTLQPNDEIQLYYYTS